MMGLQINCHYTNFHHMLPPDLKLIILLWFFFALKQVLYQYRHIRNLFIQPAVMVY